MQSQSKTLMPGITAKTRVITSSVLFGCTVIAAIGYAPYLIVAAFLAVQLGIKSIDYDPVRRERPFREYLLVGPAKVATALFMIMGGIPADSAGLFWIGIMLVLLTSGIKDMYAVMRAGQTGIITAPVPVGTARQKAKENKAEEYLLSDLADFLGKDDEDGVKG